MSDHPATGPIAAATARLVSWLTQHAAGTAVHVGPPKDTDAGPVELTVWPLALLPEPGARSTVGRQRDPFRLQVRHLVTAGGPAGSSAAALDRVLVAAVETGEAALTVVLEPLPPHTWLALRALPRAALLIDVPAQIARPLPRVPVVRRPLRVQSTPLRPLHGRVVGPGDMPLAGIRVEVVATGTSTYTDATGSFDFAALPADQPTRLRLRGKDRPLLAELDAPITSGSVTDPVIIHCDLEEV
jgi:hypothetical protein